MGFTKLLFAAIFGLITIAGLGRGENPTDFTVESPQDGKKFILSEHKGKVVVLHFLLKTECPYCLRYTSSYAKLAETNPEIVHLFLKPDSPSEIQLWEQKIDTKGLDKAPSIYCDPEASLARKFNIPDGYRFHGQTVHYPALVALDGNGKEMFRYVGKSNSDRMAPKDFVVKLKSSGK